MRRGRRINMGFMFFDEKEFRMGYTCVSSLIATLEGSSLLSRIRFVILRPLTTRGHSLTTLTLAPHYCCMSPMDCISHQHCTNHTTVTNHTLH